MIFKFVKFIFLLSITGTIGYYVVHSQENSKSDEVKSSITKENSTDKIKYTKEFKGGILNLTATKADLKSQNNIHMKEMKAVFNKNGKTIVIESCECYLKMKEQKAYLKKNVHIKSADTACDTEYAVIDFPTNSISGDSKMVGTRSGTNFVSNGFFMDENGIIKLKRATIKKCG